MLANEDLQQHHQTNVVLHLSYSNAPLTGQYVSFFPCLTLVPVSYTHLDVYKRQASTTDKPIPWLIRKMAKKGHKNAFEQFLFTVGGLQIQL